MTGSCAACHPVVPTCPGGTLGDPAWAMPNGRRRSLFGLRRAPVARQCAPLSGGFQRVLSGRPDDCRQIVGRPRDPAWSLAIPVDGAAPESNRPSVGLPHRTGFEDLLGHRAHAAPRPEATRRRASSPRLSRAVRDRSAGGSDYCSRRTASARPGVRCSGERASRTSRGGDSGPRHRGGRGSSAPRSSQAQPPRPASGRAVRHRPWRLDQRLRRSLSSGQGRGDRAASRGADREGARSTRRALVPSLIVGAPGTSRALQRCWRRRAGGGSCRASHSGSCLSSRVERLLARLDTAQVQAGTVRRSAGRHIPRGSSRRRCPCRTASPIRSLRRGMPGTSTPSGQTRSAPRGPGFPITVFDSGLDINPPGLRRPCEHNPPESAKRRADQRGVSRHDGRLDGSRRAQRRRCGGDLLRRGSLAQLRLRLLDRRLLLRRVRSRRSQAGPSVMNMSFGGTEASRADYEANIATFAEGSLLVAAAGNEYEDGNPTNYPGAYPHVLTVAATDQTGAPASFSSAGPQVDIAAPGVAIPVQDPQDPNRLLPGRRDELLRPDRVGGRGLGDDRAADGEDPTLRPPPLQRAGRGTGGVGGEGQLRDPRRPRALRDGAPAGRPAGAERRHRPGHGRGDVRGGEAHDRRSRQGRPCERPRRRGGGPPRRLPGRRSGEDAPDAQGSPRPASLGLSLWSDSATTVSSGTRGRLASAAGSTATKTVTWANRSTAPRVVFADVRTATQAAHLNATYHPPGSASRSSPDVGPGRRPERPPVRSARGPPAPDRPRTTPTGCSPRSTRPRSGGPGRSSTSSAR